MNLDFSDEQKSLKLELNRLLQSRSTLAGPREALEGRAPHDEKLWLELGELGWLSVAIPEAFAGQGQGYEMLCCVAEEIGRSVAAVPIASSIFLAAEALLQFGSEELKEEHLPALGSGKAIGAFAIAEQAGPLRPESIAAEYAGGALTGKKIGVADGMIADLFVTVALRDGEPGLFLVRADDVGVRRELRTGVDPSHPPATVVFHNAQAVPLARLGWAGIRRLLDRAATLIAFEQLGTADAALQDALAYARDRKAFGRQIGSFQAIKHKLADVWIANELARSNAYFGAWALQADAPELGIAAATARVSASEALERAARELIQVHGGIAVTWEHDAHLYYRRGQHLSLVLGGLREWQSRLVQQLAEVA
jgi:acyl-CoA dehydrogenase